VVDETGLLQYKRAGDDAAAVRFLSSAEDNYWYPGVDNREKSLPLSKGKNIFGGYKNKKAVSNE
jgi:hypothetical protein